MARARRVAAALTSAGLLAASVAVPAAGDDQGADTATEGPVFRDGDWVATLGASGPASVEFPQASIDLSTVMQGTASFTTADAEILDGTWSVSGASSGVVDSPLGSGAISNTLRGSGPVQGDAEVLVLGGAIDTTWTMSVGGQQDVYDDPVRLGPFEIEVTATDCRTVVGSWEEPFAAEIADAGGWESSLSGGFQAHHLGADPDEAIADEFDDWYDDALALIDAIVDGDYEDADGRVVVDDGLYDHLWDLARRTVRLHEELDALDPDQRCLFPRATSEYTTMFTALLQEIAWLALQEPGALSGYGIMVYGEVLLSLGGIGSGTLRPERAAELEVLFAARVGEIVEDHLITDAVGPGGAACTPDTPCLPQDDDVVDALLTAQRLGLTLEVDGREVAPEDVDEWLTWLGEDDE